MSKLIALKRGYSFLFFSMVLLLPFNGIRGLSFLGELRADAASHIMLCIIGVFLLFSFLRLRIYIPISNKLWLMLLIFTLVSIGISLLSLDTIPGNRFKGEGGLSRLMNQSILLFVYSIVFTVFLYNLIRESSCSFVYNILQQAISISFVIVASYSILELPLLAGKNWTYSIVKVLESVIQGSYRGLTYPYVDRIRSVCAEPPFLAMYLSFVSPILLSRIYKGRNVTNGLLILAIIIVLVLLSGSRTALIIVTLEFALYFFLKPYDSKLRIKRRKVLRILLFTSIIITPIVGVYIVNKVVKTVESLNVNSDEELANSSVARFGTQVAALEIFKDHKFKGVGLGQQGFYFHRYYPGWSYISWEIRDKWSVDTQKTWPPGFNMHTRLLAEVGLISYLLFLAFNVLIFIKAYKNVNKVKSVDAYLMNTSVCVAFFGVFINTFQFDSFRFIPYWLLVSLILFRNEKHEHITNSSL